MDDDEDASDCDGHGTHTASTAIGRAVGAARAARLVAVRALDCEGSGTVSTTVAGAWRGSGILLFWGGGGGRACGKEGRNQTAARMEGRRGGHAASGCAAKLRSMYCDMCVPLPGVGAPPPLPRAAPPMAVFCPACMSTVPRPTRRRPGLDWVARHARRPAVVMLSLGVPNGTWSRALSAAVRSLAGEHGLTVVAASGNAGQDACGISPAGDYLIEALPGPQAAAGTSASSCIMCTCMQQPNNPAWGRLRAAP